MSLSLIQGRRGIDSKLLEHLRISYSFWLPAYHLLENLHVFLLQWCHRVAGKKNIFIKKKRGFKKDILMYLCVL